jgi:putative MFS transporter
MAAPTISYFRLAALAALFVAPIADIVGRRRLLLFTIFGEAVMTLLTALSQNYTQFVAAQIAARIFGYSEELLCYVVIAEEIDARVRGWATGTLSAMGATGAGLAAIIFAAVNILPHGWRALYVIGGSAFLVLAYYRRWLPETTRFEVRRTQIAAMESRIIALSALLRGLFRDHPTRLVALMLFVACFGFAMGPAAVLMSKYLQQTHHYSPGNVSLLFLIGGSISIVGNVLAGRVSDRIGRKRTLFVTVIMAGGGYAVFYSGLGGWTLPVAWVVAIIGFLSADALAAGYPAEIFPTAYRATAAGIRYVTMILGGALALTLEGRLYDWFGAHGPAISILLLAIPVSMAAILLLPETAQRTLEDISNPE